MFGLAKLGGVLLACACVVTAAQSAESKDNNDARGKSAFESVYGRALPPIGFVEMCERLPDECSKIGGKPTRLSLSPERWNLIYQVNAFVNGKIAPVSDEELYGKPEYWAFPTDAGDCEDYLLLKKRYLEGLGFAPEALLITVVLDEKNQGHAVLTVTTDRGDVVLDNRRNEVLAWNETGYIYLKRQSAGDPKQWVSLIRRQPAMTGNFAAGGARGK
jgi:predicted transglutaminase-like cysteine proteinase